MAGARLASLVQHQVTACARATSRLPYIRANDEIGRMPRRIDAAIDHLNVLRVLVGELDKMKAASARREALKPPPPSSRSARACFARRDAEGDEMNLNRIRAPLAFILAEELTRSYLPNYVNQLLVVIPAVAPGGDRPADWCSC